MTIQNYTPGSRDPWQGRTDSKTDFDAFRWHQWVQPINLTTDSISLPPEALGVVFIGFCCDEGVRLNRGRTGAANGPHSIRKELANLPCWFNKNVTLYDAGDINCEDSPLEDGQKALKDSVERILDMGLFPIVLGGGHEIALGHYRGIRDHLLKRSAAPRIGIVNFDAHLDLRPYDAGGNSGTMFRQIADECAARQLEYGYLCVGAQRYSNTFAVFRTAEELGAKVLLSKDLAVELPWQAIESIEDEIQRSDALYVTICSDVFSSAYAPGVSATQPLGIEPELVLKLLKLLFRSGKVVGFDIAEVAPRFDQDNTTANLAKVLIFSAVNALAELKGLARQQ